MCTTAIASSPIPGKSHLFHSMLIVKTPGSIFLPVRGYPIWCVSKTVFSKHQKPCMTSYGTMTCNTWEFISVYSHHCGKIKVSQITTKYQISDKHVIVRQKQFNVSQKYACFGISWQKATWCYNMCLAHWNPEYFIINDRHSLSYSITTIIIIFSSSLARNDKNMLLLNLPFTVHSLAFILFQYITLKGYLSWTTKIGTVLPNWMLQ